MTKTTEPLSFGKPCPYCHAPHQVWGMKCLECHNFIFTTTQKVIIVVTMIIVAVAVFLIFNQPITFWAGVLDIVLGATYMAILNRLFGKVKVKS